MAGLNLPIVEPSHFQVEVAAEYEGATTQQAGLNKPAWLHRGLGFLAGLAGFMLIASVVISSPSHTESPSGFSLASFTPGGMPALRGTQAGAISSGQTPVMQMRSPMERSAQFPTVPLRDMPPAMQMSSPASDPLGLEPREEPLRAQATTVYSVPSSHINRMQPGQNIVNHDSGVSGSTLGWLSILALSTAGAYMAGKSVDKLGGQRVKTPATTATSAMSLQPTASVSRTSAVTMSQESEEHVTRRDLLAQAAGASALLGAVAANAEVDYAGVGYLGGSKTIDINNANVRVYQKLQGMYPNAAGKIVSKAPFKDKADMYTKAGFTAREAETVKKYDANFIFLEPRPEYIIDNINNGLYR